MADSEKPERQHKIRQLIETGRISRQDELVERLGAVGVVASQSVVSRDIHELGIAKVDGRYLLGPQVRSALASLLTAAKAGPNLLVIKTQIGAAQHAAVEIDRLAVTGIVGTVAGDDTIFIATKGSKAQAEVLRQLGVPALE